MLELIVKFMKYFLLHIGIFFCVISSYAQNSIMIAIHGSFSDISGQTHEVTLTNTESLDISFDIINQTGVTHQWRITRKKISVPSNWTDLLCWGHCTDQFGGTCFPADTLNDTWTSPSNQSVLFNINSGECGKLKVTVNPNTFATSGEARYRYYISDDGVNYSDSVDLLLNYMVSSKPVKEDILVNISPNPASDFIQITLNGGETANIKIIDALGTTLSKESIGSSKKINISELRNGVYFVVLEIPGSKTITRKVIIRH